MNYETDQMQEIVANDRDKKGTTVLPAQDNQTNFSNAN